VTGSPVAPLTPPLVLAMLLAACGSDLTPREQAAAKARALAACGPGIKTALRTRAPLSRPTTWVERQVDDTLLVSTFFTDRHDVSVTHRCETDSDGAKVRRQDFGPFVVRM
jgi:hypothetical protein